MADLSIGLTCDVCLEVILAKDNRDRLFGVLSDCNHCFCIVCIRQWRTVSNSNKCPVCRISSPFYIPSRLWIVDKAIKRQRIETIKVNMSRRPCRYFNGGRGICYQGHNCLYEHEVWWTMKADSRQVGGWWVAVNSKGQSVGDMWPTATQLMHAWINVAPHH